MALTDSDPQCCAERLVEILAAADRLVELADRGEELCRRDSCLVVYGVVRDAMWKVRTAVSACLQTNAARHGAATETRPEESEEDSKCDDREPETWSTRGIGRSRN